MTIKNDLKRVLCEFASNTPFINVLNRYSNTIDIFCFHRVLPLELYLNEAKEIQEFAVTIEFFEEFLKWVNYHYSCVSMNDVLDDFSKKIGKKKCHITFDDGYIDNLKYAAPLLEKYSMPATIYVSCDAISHRNEIYKCMKRKNYDSYMNWADLIELQNFPCITIGSHTVHHHNLTKLSLDELNFDVHESKKILENRLMSKIEHFAYPFGGKGEVSDLTRSVVIEAEYKSAVTTQCHQLKDGYDRFAISRYFVTQSCSRKIMDARVGGLCNLFKNQILM